MSRLVPILAAAALLGMAAPLQASGGEVPEPSDLALFLLGLLGVIIGRQSIAPRKDRRPED